MSAYEVRVVTQSGSVVRTLVGAVVKSITEVLNGVGSAIFTFPKVDPVPGQGADVRTLGYEIQIWSDTGYLKFWGVAVNPQTASNRGDVEMHCADLSWYFSRRAIDKVLTNFLANPGFEAGLAGWTAFGVAATPVSSPVIDGSVACQLWQSFADQDTYVWQGVTVTATGVGTLMTLTAWLWIDPGSWVGPAALRAGLYIEGRPTGTGGAPTAVNSTLIDASTPRGSWQRHTTTLAIPPGETWDLFIRLYAVGGVITWDACELVEMESEGGFNETLSQLACRAVSFIQNPDKGDLGIAVDSSAGGPVIPSKWWQFADHIFCDRALAEFTSRDNGIDWYMDLPARTFRTAYPHRGQDLTGTVIMTYGDEIAAYSYSENGPAADTDVTVLGEGGGGPDREIGHARDTSSLGTVLQGVYPCTPGATIDQLAPQAIEKLNKSMRMVRLPVITTREHPISLLDLVGLGDRITLAIADGWVNLSGAWRVVGKVIYPAKETMSLTLNEV